MQKKTPNNGAIHSHNNSLNTQRNLTWAVNCCTWRQGDHWWGAGKGHGSWELYQGLRSTPNCHIHGKVEGNMCGWVRLRRAPINLSPHCRFTCSLTYCTSAASQKCKDASSKCSNGVPCLQKETTNYSWHCRWIKKQWSMNYQEHLWPCHVTLPGAEMLMKHKMLNTGKYTKH